MNKTKIDWCDVSWNPVTGCLHECEYCYARSIARRFGGWAYTPGLWRANIAEEKTFIVEGKSYYGEVKETEHGKIAEINEPFELENRKAPFPFGFMPTLHRYRLGEPEHMKKPRTIFVCSMADLFGAWVPEEWIKDVFQACWKAPQHRYLFLTKNPARYGLLAGKGLLPKQKIFWYGASAEDHQKAAAAFRHLPAAWQGYKFFLSAEPLHGPINLPALDEWPRWVIIGAETGNRKEKRLPERSWIDDICAGADKIGAKVFMKNSLIPIVGEENMRREFPW